MLHYFCVQHVYICHAVGADVLPVTPRLKQALLRSFDSVFTLFQFTVRFNLHGCPVLLHRTGTLHVAIEICARQQSADQLSCTESMCQ